MKPILFNTEMVQAILEGRKTVTRRVIKLDSHDRAEELGQPFIEEFYEPPYQVGDILYVRETFYLGFDGECYFYFADKCTSREERTLLDYDDIAWKPSIHMPKEAARIFLRVTDVRVEQLKSMNADSAMEEGFTDWNDVKRVWNSTIKKADRARYGWEANPWVWVIAFERISKEEAYE